MNKEIILKAKQERRASRVRAKVSGTPERPRLSIFRSNRNLFAQLIDDTKGTTLVSVHSAGLKVKGNKTEIALELGKEIAKRALSQNITSAVFDRGANRYHGRVKAVADGAREGGLDF